MYQYPLLSYLSAAYESVDLSRVLLLSCQHLLEPQLVMFEQLLKLGLQPHNCCIAGKNYSTNAGVLDELEKLGCVVATCSDQFDPNTSFDEWFEARLVAFVHDQIKGRDMSSYDKVIILDDGGFMHLVANSLCDDTHNFVGIEQTSSGHHRIRKENIRFPYISVARSHHKLMYESPYIAKCAVHKLLAKLKKLGREHPRVLVGGLGPIGRQIAGELFIVRGFEGHAVDPRVETLMTETTTRTGSLELLRYRDRILDRPFEELAWQYDLVVGATGSPLLKQQDIGRLHKHAILAQVASSDREFPVLPFREHGGGVHDDYVLQDRVLLNGGFPVTFYGERNSIPPQQIELTIALLMARVLDSVAPIHPVAYVIEQIFHMWSPDAGVDEWYREWQSEHH